MLQRQAVLALVAMAITDAQNADESIEFAKETTKNAEANITGVNVQCLNPGSFCSSKQQCCSHICDTISVHPGVCVDQAGHRRRTVRPGEQLTAASADYIEGGVIKLDWSDCGDSSTYGHITSLEPSMLTVGTKTAIAGKGNVDEAVQAATYEVTAKALGIKIFSHSGDACKPDTINLPDGAGEIDIKGFACPFKPGAVELDLDIKLASSIPAKLACTTIDLTAKSSTGDKVLCVQIKTAPAANVIVV